MVRDVESSCFEQMFHRKIDYPSRWRSRWENLDRFQHWFQPIKFVNSVIPSPCKTQPYNREYFTKKAQSRLQDYKPKKPRSRSRHEWILCYFENFSIEVYVSVSVRNIITYIQYLLDEEWSFQRTRTNILLRFSSQRLGSSRFTSEQFTCPSFPSLRLQVCFQ